MDLDFYDNLSDDARMHRWPSDNTVLRAGRNSDRNDENGHAGYASALLARVRSKAGEIKAALDAQGTFRQTSRFAQDTPLLQILSAFADVAADMDAQWARHQAGKTVAVIDGNGRSLIDQATGGLYAHMKSYSNAVNGDRIGEINPPEPDLPADVSGVTADTLKVDNFLIS